MKKKEHVVHKPWGKEVWLELNDRYCYKRIYINQGYKTSFQYHNHKIETNYLISGKAEVWLENEDGVVESVWTAGQSVIITAAVPNEKKSCLLAVMKDVTFNPKAIEEVWENYKKQTKQKDI